MFPTLLKLGPLQLSSYGLTLALAFFVGMYLAKRQGMKEGVSPAKIETLSFWVIVSAILGARFLYTFVEHGSYYWKHPLEFFAFQKGGLAFFGGLFAAVAIAIWYCHKHKLSFWKIADIYAPTIALGLSIAKIGCFLAGCCHGKLCKLPWGVAFGHAETLAHPKGVPLHPSQLYESAFTLILFLGLVLFRKYRKFEGEIFLLFLIAYGVIRSYLETFRGNPGQLGGLTTAQFLSIPMVLLAVVWFVLRLRKRNQP